MRGESDAYQTVPRAVAVMPKSYDGGVSTGWHSHPRAQLLYATSGLTLVTAEDPAGLAKRIVEEGLSVRQAEALAQMPAGAAPAAPRKAEPAQKDADTMALEKLMTDTLGMIVTIEHKDRGGAIRVAYRTLDQLDELCRRLKDER